MLGAQVLGIHKSTKIIVIGKYKNLIFAVFEVVISIFKCFNNGQ